MAVTRTHEILASSGDQSTKYCRYVTPDQPDQQRVAEATETTANSMSPQWFPVNAYEASEALVVVAPMAAVLPGDVTITLEPKALHVSARLRSSGPRDYLVHEWEYGGYERTVDLPEGFGGGLEATLMNGQLVVRVLRGSFVEQISVQPHTL
jgi:HSP20 family molecular chaperone IbpA